ncbi:MAG: hypothetical protein ACRYGO_03315 [Janthinobacterium lividum]
MHKSYALVAAACLLAAPLASGAECAGVSLAAVSDASEQLGNLATLGGSVEGLYTLSNGARVKVLDSQQGLVAVFEHARPVRLREVGTNRYASPEGDVELTWVPAAPGDTILLNYPADSAGRLRRSCD